jgi:hypothetical protein
MQRLVSLAGTVLDPTLAGARPDNHRCNRCVGLRIEGYGVGKSGVGSSVL